MDLNKIPNDHMVIEPIFEVESRINVNEVEKRCSEVEDKCLALEIRNKEVELEEISGKIRVLEGEKAKIEEEVKGLREKRLNLEGREAREAVSGELLLDGWNEEESKIDQLMIENKVLECEKSFALREVEKWKRKCGEFELRVRELEKRLSIEGEDDNHGICSVVKEDIKDVVVGTSSKFGTINVEVEIEGTPSMGKQVKRRLDFNCDRSCGQKMAPSTPTGASVAFIDIDSDHDPDVPVENGLCLQSEVAASVMLDATMDVEDDIGDERNDTLVKTPKRKRHLTVVNSGDELEEDEDLPKRRAFKIGNSDNEAEDDDSEDALPIKLLFKRVESSCQSDDEDNIPISQLKMNRGRGTRRSVRLQKKNISGLIADDHDSRNRPKRRLVKRGHKIEASSDGLTKKYMEGEESEDDDSGSDDSLSDFIVNDTDVEESEDDLPADANHHSQEDEEASDDNVSFGDILSQIQRCKDPNLEWVDEPDMLSAFGKDPELCMRAVCAVYRRQIAKEKLWMDGFHHIGIGFNKYDESRGTELGDFLTDGNPDNDVMKTVEELEAYDPEGPDVCYKLAARYSTQLFEMYQTEEDEFFP
ncbi:uncharacterized protein LOC141656681 [Silene latifolia]|uniref:uncharacterized protein LOC141656681 n=1 Tax=Silene latifolia TaxID=37657 RepID=UPI003D7719BB